LPAFGADQLSDLFFHDRLGHHAHRLAQRVHVRVGSDLAEQLEQFHAVLGHRVFLSAS
jgi:hypothetical protein